MKVFRKLGSMALAAAMTITLVAPVNANAFYSDENNSATYTRNDDGEITRSNTTSSTTTNKVTGATYTYNNETDEETGDEYAASHYSNGIRKKLDVGTNGYASLDVDLNPGDDITSIKITKGSKYITMKKSDEYSEKVHPDWDSDAKQYYFRNLDGTKEYISLASNHTQDEYEAAGRIQKSYSFRIFGKKKGTAEIKVVVKDAAGKSKTSKVKVTVSDDARAITGISYAGKKLLLNHNKGAAVNTYEAQSTNKAGNYYFTKKSGKFKVTMGKNYKFVNAYVITPNAYTTKTTNDDDSWEGYVDKETTTYAVRQYSYGLDLNNDGDYEDTIDGISERRYRNCSYKKVKNNKNIKLNTVPDKTDITTTNTYGSTGQYSRNSVEKSSSNMADTYVIIVYQDKVTKEFHNYGLTLTYRTSKK